MNATSMIPRARRGAAFARPRRAVAAKPLAIPHLAAPRGFDPDPDRPRHRDRSRRRRTDPSSPPRGSHLRQGRTMFNALTALNHTRNIKS